MVSHSMVTYLKIFYQPPLIIRHPGVFVFVECQCVEIMDWMYVMALMWSSLLLLTHRVQGDDQNGPTVEQSFVCRKRSLGKCGLTLNFNLFVLVNTLTF